MSKLIYYRIYGYITNLTLHMANFKVMNSVLGDRDEIEIRNYNSMTWQLFTIWNCTSQLCYSIFGIISDILTLVNGREGQVISKCISLREKCFRIFIWPNSIFTMLTFWPLYFYNRDVWAPSIIFETIPLVCNLILHGAVFIFVLWEFKHLPRNETMNHTMCLILQTVMLGSYALWTIYSYSVTGLWPYPGASLIYATVYFPIAMSIFYVIMLFSYYTQYPMAELVWGSKKAKTI